MLAMYLFGLAGCCVVWQSYASEVQEHGSTVAVSNLDRSDGDEDADFLLLGPCESALPGALSLSPVRVDCLRALCRTTLP